MLRDPARQRTVLRARLLSAAALAASLVMGPVIGVVAADNPSLKSELTVLAHDWERVTLQISDRNEQERQMITM